MLKEDLPKYVVKIQYKKRSLEEAKKKKDDPMMNACTRYLYVYAHESLDERMAKAWRADAVAEVFQGSYTREHAVKASGVKGIWE